MKLVAGVLLGLAATAVWVFWPIRHIAGPSWCDRVATYEQQQRFLHGGKVPLLAGIRVDLSTCGVTTKHTVFNP